ncbi:MAG TPA: helix-turn-helix domain-containing protein [Candidatus Binatia bacterium]|jgi:DNA-binding HxlR family transcriptional regulator
MRRGNKEVGCPAELTLDVIRGKWKLLILQQLYVKVTRFGELHRVLKGISEKVLAQELRDLERRGIITRKMYAEIPPKVEYSITPLGKRLEAIVTSMHDWGLAYLESQRSEDAGVAGRPT